MTHKNGCHNRAPLRETVRTQEPVAWSHGCNALCTDIDLWIDHCPHCGKPRPTDVAPQPVQEPAPGYKVVPPNASGETNCTVRWMIETDLGWVGAYDKEVLTNLLAAAPQTPEQPRRWTNADADAARLALELECLLLDTEDLAVTSKWWDSGMEALELHHKRLADEPLPEPCDSQDLTLAYMAGYERGEDAALSAQPVDTARVLEWMRTPGRKSAQLAFTAGPERQAAYWIEIAQGESNIQTQITPDISPLTNAEIRNGRFEGYDAEDAPEAWAFAQGVRFAEKSHGIGEKDD